MPLLDAALLTLNAMITTLVLKTNAAATNATTMLWLDAAAVTVTAMITTDVLPILARMANARTLPSEDAINHGF